MTGCGGLVLEVEGAGDAEQLGEIPAAQVVLDRVGDPLVQPLGLLRLERPRQAPVAVHLSG